MIQRFATTIALLSGFTLMANAQQTDNKKQVSIPVIQVQPANTTPVQGNITAYPSKTVVQQESAQPDTATTIVSGTVITTNQKRRPE
jgi:hypothetical protein